MALSITLRGTGSNKIYLSKLFVLLFKFGGKEGVAAGFKPTAIKFRYVITFGAGKLLDVKFAFAAEVDSPLAR